MTSERPKLEAETAVLLECGVRRSRAISGGDVGSQQASRAGGWARRGDEDLEVNLAGIVGSGVLSRNDYD